MQLAVPPPVRSAPAPTPADVLALQAARGPALASVLLATSPGPSLRDDDAGRLAGLLQQAERRLCTELPAADARAAADGLRRLAVDAAVAPARAALALFASPHVNRWFSLPVLVRERVVVDPTFATRDLVRALHRTPRHVLLVLTAAEARLFEGRDGQLVPAGSRFPLRAERLPSRSAYLRTVDAALSAHLRSHPAPLVLAGVDRLTAEFRRLSRCTARLAGSVPGSRLERPLPELAELARPVLEQYLLSREREAIETLERTPRSRTASGLDAAWLASRWQRPEMLVVEEDLFVPARICEDGDRLLPVGAAEVEAPDVVDDVVDELIEAVLRRGGWVALASPGALAAHGGVALTLRG